MSNLPRIVAYLVFFVILGSSGLCALSVLSTTSAEVNISVLKDPRFPAQLQAGYGVSQGVEYTWDTGFFTSLELGYVALRDTGLASGTGYSGIAGIEISLDYGYVSYRDGSRVLPGIGGEIRGNFVRYIDTPLLFFYPAISVYPSAQFELSPGSDLRFALPVRWHVRLDTQFHVSVGVAATFLL